MLVRSDLSSSFLLLSVLHIHFGIAEMMADHVPPDLPRFMIVVYNRWLLLLVFKDVFYYLVGAGLVVHLS